MKIVNVDGREHAKAWTVAEIAELLRLIERKNALGISFEELKAFEAALSSAPETPAPAAAPAAPARPDGTPWPVKAGTYPVGPRRDEERTERICSQCDSPMELGRWGKYYCKPCYMERKDRKERR